MKMTHALLMATLAALSMGAKNMPSFSRQMVHEINQENNPAIHQHKAAAAQKESAIPRQKLVTYEPKDYSYLFGMPGFSNKALSQHFTLYQGYVKNTNQNLRILAEMSSAGQQKTPAWADIKRRLGWEFDGMRLHEMYFDNLGGKQPIDPNSRLARAITATWGSIDNWKQDFIDTGAMRGIGWAVLYQDPVTGQLLNMWINEHDRGHIAGGTPILIMDVFEHAYMTDYGLDRGAYIDAFYKNINWQVVEDRYNTANPLSTTVTTGAGPS